MKQAPAFVLWVSVSIVAWFGVMKLLSLSRRTEEQYRARTIQMSEYTPSDVIEIKPDRRRVLVNGYMNPNGSYPVVFIEDGQPCTINVYPYAIIRRVDD